MVATHSILTWPRYRRKNETKRRLDLILSRVKAKLQRAEDRERLFASQGESRDPYYGWSMQRGTSSPDPSDVAQKRQRRRQHCSRLCRSCLLLHPSRSRSHHRRIQNKAESECNSGLASRESGRTPDHSRAYAKEMRPQSAIPRYHTLTSSTPQSMSAPTLPSANPTQPVRIAAMMPAIFGRTQSHARDRRSQLGSVPCSSSPNRKLWHKPPTDLPQPRVRAAILIFETYWSVNLV